MSNILKVTTPVGGYENRNNIRTNPLADSEVHGIQTPVVPQKVVRADGRTDAGMEEKPQMRLNYESNYNNFVKALKDAPASVEKYMEILKESMEMLNQPGISSGLRDEITQFLSMIGLSQADMAGFVKEQADMALRFRGPLFDLLRQVFNDTESVELRTAILDFVRKYADMAAGGHTMQTVSDMLEKCRDHMFTKSGDELERMIQRLMTGGKHVDGNTDRNASLLKEKIIPFLNRYITATHDRGSLRNLTAHISYQLARYENGNMEGLLQSYTKLLGYQDFRKVFGSMDEAMLEAVLRKAAGQEENADWSSGFAKLLQSGINGERGVEARQISQNMMNAVLLNESVYMPVLHMLLPMLVDGKLMYSEMWVDPDDRDSNPEGGKEEGRTVKALIKFNIDQVGYFELFFLYRNEKMEIQLDYPDTFKEREKDIRESISRILAENGIRLQNFVTGSSKESIPLTEAFPKILERKNTVNVRV